MKTFTTLALFCLLLSAWASNDNAVFSNYSRNEGLSHKFIYNIIRDSEGFLWIATASGLSRYDGYTFQNYENNSHRKNGIEGTAIFGIDEGTDNKIWLSTDNGIGYFDKVSEQFVYLNNPILHTNNFKKDMCVDEQGKLWLFNQKLKFIVYNPKSDSIEMHISNYTTWGVDSSFALSHFSVCNNQIWVSSNQGIGYYDLAIKKFFFVDKRPLSHCHTFRRVDKNTFVISYMFDGVYVVDITRKTFKFVERARIDKQTGFRTTLFDASVEADSTLWISVSPGIVSIKNNTITYYSNNSSQHYFSGDVVSCFFRDANNNFWMGTYGDGIFLKNTNTSSFKFSTRLNKTDIKSTHVSSFMVFDNDAVLYRDTRGIYYCNSYKQLTPHCAKQIYKPEQLLLHPINGTHALISCVDTFWLFSAAQQTLKRAFIGLAPSCVYLDKNGIIWCGSWHGHLYGYDTEKNKRYEIVTDESFPIVQICGDAKGALWLGTTGLGVVHITNPQSSKPTIEYLNKNSNAKQFLSSNIINCLYVDSKDNVWIGTNGAGLQYRDAKTANIQSFSTRNGLKSNIIESIIEDGDGNIWFSSTVLSKYNATNKMFTHYSSADGISGSFVSRASYRALKGDLLFATTEGLYVFNPHHIRENGFAPQPIFTNLRIKGLSVHAGDSIDEQIPYQQSITYSHQLELPYNLNSFAIEFASIHFQKAQTINYEYTLEGVDNAWILADTRTRLAAYSGLQAGNYVFKVRASFGGGGWSKPCVLLIKIAPPWWKTLWFRLLATLLIALSIGYFFYARIRKITVQKQLLETMVADRTARLQEASEQLSVQAQSLQIQNISLHDQKVMIELKNQQLHESLNAKDTLIGIIAHDFKNPLAAIHGMSIMLRDNIRQFDSAKISNYLDSIIASSDNLKNQMLTVLDWAQGKVQDVVCRPVEVNIETLINDSLELVRETAQQKQISLSTQFDYAAMALIDPRMISTVLRNLLMNAIKFTPRGGLVSVAVLEYAEGIEVVVEDNGVGIKPEVIDQLFDNQQQHHTYGTENERGIGLGLQICKSFIEQNGGTISVQSEEGRGSKFRITMPKASALAVRCNLQRQALAATELPDATGKLSIDKTQTILIVDDNKNLLDLMSDIFEQYFSIITATDGQLGLELAQNTVPSLIISDITMPQIDGLTLCERLKNNEMTSHIPIILLTSESKYEREGFLIGADDFIEKPFNRHTLLLKVHALLENRKKLILQLQGNSDARGFILPESLSDLMMQKTFAYINSNFSNSNIDINEVADHVGLSRSQLWRKFKASTGQNLSDYVLELRLQKAREMLLTGRYKVAEVAYEVGFSNPPYFSRSFSARFGESPKDCIDKAKEKNEIASV